MSITKNYTLTGAPLRPDSSPVRGTWGGHRSGNIYGRLDCPAALRSIACGGYVKNRVFFADEATALAAGYRPCGACCRDRYQVASASRSTGTSRRRKLDLKREMSSV